MNRADDIAWAILLGMLCLGVLGLVLLVLL